MAIGLGRMFGFHFLENFNYPYICKSIREYWRRWHISLTTWFRDYLYIPMGGNRRGTFRTYFNLVTIFVLCGLWHGANWTYVIFGLYHGIFLVAERTTFGRGIDALPVPFRHLYALLVIVVGLVIFRSESIMDAIPYIQAMFGFAEGSGIKHNTAMFLTGKLKLEICIGVIFSTPLYPYIVRMKESALEKYPLKMGKGLSIASNLAGFVMLTFLVYASIISLAASAYNPFIYFRF
jgi:alginate O-acetyltransferase complex protein AlgI